MATVHGVTKKSDTPEGLTFFIVSAVILTHSDMDRANISLNIAES